MKMFNTTITSIVVAILLLGVFVFPLPVTRIRETGIVQLAPSAMMPVYLKVDGALESIYVKEGQFVRKGAVLATFTNMELQNEVQSLKTEFSIHDKVVDSFQAKISQVRDANLHNQLRRELFTSLKERNTAHESWKFKRDDVAAQLTLIAPRDGLVMGLPKKEEIGKFWEKGKSGPFCQIGDPTQLRVLIPVSPDDYEILRENLTKAKEKGTILPITLRVQGRANNTWKGRLTLDQLPRAVAKTIPLGLSTKGGGPLAVKPTSQQDQLLPQTQVYLIPVDIENPDGAIVPGTMAQVRIENEYRSAAWWIWRTISKTFELGLM